MPIIQDYNMDLDEAVDALEQLRDMQSVAEPSPSFLVNIPDEDEQMLFRLYWSGVEVVGNSVWLAEISGDMTEWLKSNIKQFGIGDITQMVFMSEDRRQRFNALVGESRALWGFEL
jgi:hypothetical protein